MNIDESTIFKNALEHERYNYECYFNILEFNPMLSLDNLTVDMLLDK